MQPGLVLVLGGTGVVGSAVLRELRRRDVTATFTYHTSAAKAHALASEHGHRALEVDLADSRATRAVLDGLPAPRAVIHCAAVSSTRTLAELEPGELSRTLAVNLESALWLCQWVARRGGPCDVVLVNGLDRNQSLPLPCHFAATQGALSALAMAAAHELGGRDIRVNVVALGLLGGGVSSELASRRRKDYETFSAMRRQGTPEEAARAIGWLALDNTYIEGKVVPVNGGI